jgi:hypothetical protein
LVGRRAWAVAAVGPICHQDVAAAEQDGPHLLEVLLLDRLLARVELLERVLVVRHAGELGRPDSLPEHRRREARLGLQALDPLLELGQVGGAEAEAVREPAVR